MPMLSTLSGWVMSVSDVHPEHAHSPMVVTPSPIVSDLRLEHMLNILSGTVFTLPDMVAYSSVEEFHLGEEYDVKFISLPIFSLFTGIVDMSSRDMGVSPSLMTNSSSDSHPSNALYSMVLMLLSTVNYASDVQPLKAYEPIVVTVSGRLTDVSDVHPLNMLPVSVIGAWMSADVMKPLYENAVLSIFVTS